MRRVKRPLRRPPARKLFCECLEDRTVLSGGLLAAPVSLLSAAPLQAPATTSAPAASDPLAGLLDNSAVHGLAAPAALNVSLRVDVSLPGVLHLDVAPALGVGGNHVLLAQVTLDASVSVLGANVLSTSTGAAVGLGGGTVVRLAVTTNTTLAGGSLLTLNGDVGAAVGGSQGAVLTTGIALQAGGEGGLTVNTGGTVLLPNGGGSVSTGGGLNLGNTGGTNGGASGGGSVIAAGNGGHSGQLPPILPGPAGSSAAGTVVTPSSLGGRATAALPVSAPVGPTDSRPALLFGGTSDMTAADLLPATAAGVQEATAGQALPGGAADALFLQDGLLFGAANDTDLANVVVPELPAAPAEPVVPTAEPVVAPGELYDGGTSLLPEGDGLAQGCVPFDVKSLDDALHNLLHQFQLLSGDFSGLLGRLAGSPWFVAMAVLAVTCEVCRRKVHKARRDLLFADSDLTWFPRLTGSGSSEVS